MQLLRLELELDKQWKEMQTVKDKLRRMTMKYCRIQTVSEREKQILAQNLNDERKKVVNFHTFLGVFFSQMVRHV